MDSILTDLLRTAESFDEASRQSFLFDLQRLIWPADWHRAIVVVGTVRSRNTLAVSPFALTPESDGVSAVLELYDSFFSSLKYTLVYRTQMEHQWETDVNVFSPSAETMLMLA